MSSVFDPFNASVVYDFGARTHIWHGGFVAVEGTFTAFVFVGMALTALLCYVSLTVPQFHINYNILLMNLFVSYMGISIPRQIVFFVSVLRPEADGCFQTDMMLTQSTLYLEYFRLVSMIAFLIANAWVIIERFVATVRLKDYEKRRRILALVFIIIGQWILSAVIVAAIVVGYLPVVVCMMIGQLMSFTVPVLWRVAVHINKARYQQSRDKGNMYTLSEKYQLSENIRTEPAVTALTYSTTVTNSFCFWLYFLITYLKPRDQKLIAKLAFDMLMTIYAIAVDFHILRKTKKWRDAAIEILTRRRRRNPNVHVQDLRAVYEEKLVTANGDRMYFDTHVNTEVYFLQLQSSWR